MGTDGKGKPRRMWYKLLSDLVIFIGVLVGVSYILAFLQLLWISFCVFIGIIFSLVYWDIGVGLGAGFVTYLIGIVLALIAGLPEIISDLGNLIEDPKVRRRRFAEKRAEEKKAANSSPAKEWTPPPVPPKK